MARKKFFPASSSEKQTEISLVYQSVTESTLGRGLSSSLQGHYERIGTDGASSSNGGGNPAGTENNGGSNKSLKLGRNSSGRLTRTRVRLVCILKAPANFMCKVKEQYALWKDGARSVNIRVSDLFVSNQIFMHVQTTPVNNRRKQQGLKPSVGFVTKVEAPSSGQREMRER